MISTSACAMVYVVIAFALILALCQAAGKDEE